MTINREKLIKLLVEKTELKQAEVEAQLDELTNRILDAANRGKALEIKDFGLFYFDEKGQLSFKAADQLDKEINYQYAGMEPVELKPAKRQGPAAEKESSEEPEPRTAGDEEKKSDPVVKDDVFGIGRTLSGEKEKEDVGNGEDDASEVTDPFEKLFQDPAAEVKPQKKETLHKAGTTAKKKSPVKKQPASSDKKKSRDPMTMIIVIILGFVVLTVGYLMVSEYLEAPEPAQTETAEPIPLEEPPVTAEVDATETEEPVEQEEVGDGEEALSEEPDTPPQDERFGLHGNYVESSGLQYTIVLHSLPTIEHAERTAQELRQEGYRTVVTERTVDDRVVFRVGIGQFETIQSALSEAESLPEPYRNQNFIHRIQ
ncbi:hypothetical protein BH23BAC3_BH23BAC3_00130 [soil metagenome]